MSNASKAWKGSMSYLLLTQPVLKYVGTAIFFPPRPYRDRYRGTEVPGLRSILIKT